LSNSRILLVEELEARVLYSADSPLLSIDTAALAPNDGAIVRMADSASMEASSSAQQVAARIYEMVFIDTQVEDWEALEADIFSQAQAGRDIEVVLLAPGRDGIAQISDALNGRQGVSAIHVFAHGAAGEIQLGSGALDFDSLLVNASEIRQWGDALTADADILLYGCGQRARCTYRS
jgi:Domain of unknown function (DUF4347)